MTTETDNNSIASHMRSHADNSFLSMGCAALAFSFFGMMGALTKIMTETHSVVEIVFYRNALTIIPVFLFMLSLRRPQIFQTKMPFIMMIRCIGGALSMLLTFTGLSQLPYSDFTIILFTSALLTPLLAHFILKEMVGYHREIAIFIGLCGVFFMVRPNGDINISGIFITFMAAASHSMIYIVLRYMRSESPITITFYFVLSCTLVAGVFMPWFARTVNITDLVLFLIIGILGGAAQYSLTMANKYGPASLVVPFSYTGLIWATGFDILIWDYAPPWQVYVGAMIIIGAKFYILYREKTKVQMP